MLLILAGYIVAAEEQGVKQAQLTGTIQNDILKEYLTCNDHIYSAWAPSMRDRLWRLRFHRSQHMPAQHYQYWGATKMTWRLEASRSCAFRCWADVGWSNARLRSGAAGHDRPVVRAAAVVSSASG